DERDTDARPWRLGAAGELGALRLEVGAHLVDLLHGQPEMVEPLVRVLGQRLGPRVLAHIQDEDVRAAELQVDARLALLRGAVYLRAEHALVECSRRLRIGREQMDMVEGVAWHPRAPLMSFRYREMAVFRLAV